MSKVLILVNDRQVLKLFGDSLARNNHVPLLCDDYAQFLDDALKKHPDIIILEYQLEMIDIIFEILNTIHQAFFGYKTPIVWVFYHKYDYHIVREHMKGKVDRLVSFPFDPDEEFATIK